jgi:hypothetical protein
VQSGGGYADWAAKFPGADLANPTADLDGDGLSNNEERLPKPMFRTAPAARAGERRRRFGGKPRPHPKAASRSACRRNPIQALVSDCATK